MNGNEYANLIADYIDSQYGERGIYVYREVSLGKTIIGKNRRLDIFLLHRDSNKAYAIECKYQGVSGTTDEKILYSIEDIDKLPVDACIAYAGNGFSKGVIHLLEAYPFSAFCLPKRPFKKNSSTKELDQLLAMKFGWWDIILENKETYQSNMGVFKKS